MNIAQKIIISDWEIVHTFSHEFFSPRHDLKSTAYAIIRYSPIEDIYDYDIRGTYFNSDYNQMEYKCKSVINQLINKAKESEVK